MDLETDRLFGHYSVPAAMVPRRRDLAWSEADLQKDQSVWGLKALLRKECSVCRLVAL